MPAPSIGLVDDSPVALTQIRAMLRRAGFADVRVHEDPRLALVDFAATPPDLLLLDYRMPGLNGVQLLEQLQRRGVLGRTPVALVSGAPDLDAVRLEALRVGAHAVYAKPLRGPELALNLRNLMRLTAATTPVPAPAPPPCPSDFQPLFARRVEPEEAPPHRSVAAEEALLRRMLRRVASIRDEGTGQHVERVAHYAASIAAACGLGLREQEMLRVAAPLHDIGKIGVADSILLKRGPLTPDERLEMQRHTTLGHALLHDEDSPLLMLGAEIALTHHERWDGAGYPQGLAGDATPLSGRIVALADVFDALTSMRPYKAAWPVDRAVATIRAERGRQFDPAIVDAFVESLDDMLRAGRRFPPTDDEEAALDLP